MTFDVHHGDAVATMREKIGTRSIDMVYSDPPFGNQQIWTGTAGSFDDRWSVSDASLRGWHSLQQHSPAGASLVAITCQGNKSATAYLGAMAAIIIEAHRVLKPTGTLWLHFDDTMGAHLRVLCDAIFGPQLCIGTLVWKRTVGGHANAVKFGRVHDTIACYGRTEAARWRLWRIGTLGGDPINGSNFGRFDDFARAEPLNQAAKERNGYPTQKPVALLEELIRASTLMDDIVLDPTCGSGTTLVAALGLNRRAVGIDQSADAIAVVRARIDKRPQRQTDLFGAVA